MLQIDVSELIFSAGYGFIGCLISLMTLPWKRLLASDKPMLEYFGIWALLWPFFIALGIWRGIHLYQDAWWDYLLYEKHRKSSRHD